MVGGGKSKGSSSSQTDPIAAALARELFGLAKEELAAQRAFRGKYVEPFLKALGLDTGGDMSQLGPIFKEMFGQDLEQIESAFGGQQTALIDSLAQQGFRTGSQAAGQTQLGLGKAQSQVDARRSALMNQLGALFQGANIASGNIGQFGTNLFAPSLGAFSPLQKSKNSQFSFNLF